MFESATSYHSTVVYFVPYLSEVGADRHAPVLIILSTPPKEIVTTSVDFPVRLSIVLFITKVFVADLGNFHSFIQYSV